MCKVIVCKVIVCKVFDSMEGVVVPSSTHGTDTHTQARLATKTGCTAQRRQTDSGDRQFKNNSRKT